MIDDAPPRYIKRAGKTKGSQCGLGVEPSGLDAVSRIVLEEARGDKICKYKNSKIQSVIQAKTKDEQNQSIGWVNGEARVRGIPLIVPVFDAVRALISPSGDLASRPDAVRRVS